MTSVTMTVDSKGARIFLVKLQAELSEPRGLNEALGLRLAEELKAHFGKKNARPNKMAAPRTNFWQEVADATQLAEVTADGASVAIADARFRIHLFGGTIVPGEGKKSLTIPILREARGESVASYQRKTGRSLFTIPKRNVLFEKADQGATESLVGATKGRVRGTNRSFRVGLAGRTSIRAVFALTAKATILKDPDALPSDADLIQALQEQADDYLAAITEGGLE